MDNSTSRPRSSWATSQILGTYHSFDSVEFELQTLTREALMLALDRPLSPRECRAKQEATEVFLASLTEILAEDEQARQTAVWIAEEAEREAVLAAAEQASKDEVQS